jgi:hypothetical protein
MSGWIFEASNVNFPGSIGLHGQDNLNDNHEHLPNDSEHLAAISAAKGHGPPGGGSGGGTGTGSPPSTLVVGAPNGLEINLIWDSSVQTASNWSAIEQAVISAAKIFTANFVNPIVLNIHVGLGEVDNMALGFGAIGESVINGDYVDSSTLTTALAKADAGLVSSGLMAANAVAAAASTLAANSSFFVASAEEKVLGLQTSNTVDGYIGLSKTGLAYTSAIGAGQYDAVGIAAHELSEVMGRLGMEGTAANGGHYTPLDLFRYSTATHQPAPSQGAGTYFWTGAGTQINNYNNPTNGGDASDWATSSPATDAFNAFGTSGVTTQVTATDLLEVAALGYQPAGTLTTVTA